jgi:hypothetical protein
MTSPGSEFWQFRKCYYYSKFQQQGRFSAIWEAKFYMAIYRLSLQCEIEQDEDFLITTDPHLKHSYKLFSSRLSALPIKAD